MQSIKIKEFSKNGLHVKQFYYYKFVANVFASINPLYNFIMWAFNQTKLTVRMDKILKQHMLSSNNMLWMKQSHDTSLPLSCLNIFSDFTSQYAILKHSYYLYNCDFLYISEWPVVTDYFLYCIDLRIRIWQATFMSQGLIMKNKYAYC